MHSETDAYSWKTKKKNHDFIVKYFLTLEIVIKSPFLQRHCCFRELSYGSPRSLYWQLCLSQLREEHWRVALMLHTLTRYSSASTLILIIFIHGRGEDLRNPWQWLNVHMVGPGLEPQPLGLESWVLSNRLQCHAWMFCSEKKKSIFH